jgi:hypothetical protein
MVIQVDRDQPYPRDGYRKDVSKAAHTANHGTFFVTAPITMEPIRFEFPDSWCRRTPEWKPVL